MLREIKMDGKLVGHYDSVRGPLGHVEWFYIDAKGERQFGGGTSSVADARKEAKRRYTKERGEHLPAHLEG